MQNIHLFNINKNGKEEYLLYPHQWDFNTYLGDWNNGYRHPIVTKQYDEKLTFTTDNYSIFRGAMVLHTLRKHLGDENWWKTIKHYVKTNANKSVTTEDFRKAIEEVSGEPMDWFFDQWIYKMGHPIFEVSKKYDDSKKQLQLTIKQLQKLDSTSAYPQVVFFQGKMDIEIDGKIEQIWLEPKAENIFAFNCPRPKIVNFDYEGTWIKEVKFEKPLDELLHQFQNNTDILGKRWAMNQVVAIAKKETTPPLDKTKIEEAFKTVLSSNTFWRLKFMALPQFQSLLAAKEPAILDKTTTDLLLSLIKNEKAWIRTTALNFLGTTHDAQYADLYIGCLNDPSDRVVNAAAIALGKSCTVNKKGYKNGEI